MTSVRDEVDKGEREHSPSAGFALDVPELKEMTAQHILRAGRQTMMSSPDWLTYPPLAVLLALHNDHLPLAERQLVRVVGGAIVDGLHPLRPLFLRTRTHTHRHATETPIPPPLCTVCVF